MWDFKLASFRRVKYRAMDGNEWRIYIFIKVLWTSSRFYFSKCSYLQTLNNTQLVHEEILLLSQFLPSYKSTTKVFYSKVAMVFSKSTTS